MSSYAASDPRSWQLHAAELDKAAELIWEAARRDLEAVQSANLPVGATFRMLHLGGVFWLNAGLALENLFKGLLVKKDPSVVVNGSLSKRWRTHDLGKLCWSTGVAITSEEAFFLWVGTQSIVWAGRYPVSVRSEDPRPPTFSEADHIGYRQIYGKLTALFDDPNVQFRTYERMA